jgi:23S rRNA (uracil1939-C5)-methyltransferase
MSHCKHFGTCGGCAVDDRAAIDKRAMLIAALRQAGFPGAPVADLISTPIHTRRRVDLAAARRGADVLLGLNAARSNDVIDMTECALLTPQLFALVAPLRELLRHLSGFRRAASVIVNWLDQGPDILLRLDFTATGPDRQKMIAFAGASKAVRISAGVGDEEPEPVAVLSPPTLTLSGVPVDPAPAAFLQPSLEGEAALRAAVLSGLPKLTPKSRIVELYAGIGTFSFALQKHGRVEAYEGAPAAVAAHDLAIRRANLAGRMRIEHRDLARRPLKISEMTGAAAVVLDPPYAGAAAQMRNLAASLVPRIIYISCNPAALAKDADALRQSGYHVVTATPIDQFPYSENVESVVIFDRR